MIIHYILIEETDITLNGKDYLHLHSYCEVLTWANQEKKELKQNKKCTNVTIMEQKSHPLSLAEAVN